MMRTKFWTIALAFLVVGCGSRIDKQQPAPSSLCGNGVVDSGETCDSAIAPGEEGACPTECEADDDGCGGEVLTGSATACNAECVSDEPDCGADDGCCPMGCDSTGDSDCTNTCGNGTVEGNETCDGDCPETCDDRDTCTIDSFTGSADTCSLQCDYSDVVDCVDGDGCCPSGCTPDDDGDCSESCGNGVLDPGELCDGDCPTECDDGRVCTQDRLVGSPTTCNAQCTNDQITTCVSGDGCCPTGCTSDNDGDCACEPTTCADVGWECGDLDDGCQMTRNCGTCSATEMCSNGTCIAAPPDGSIGSACVTNADCDSGTCLDEAGFGYPGGYCTAACDLFFTPCDSGVCDGAKCVESCTDDSDCRAGYGCHEELGDSVKGCHPVGLGNGEIGDPCTSSLDCAGGRNVRCGGPEDGYKNGYCTKWCDASTSCPAGSHCVNDRFCARNCTTDGDCRGGGFDGYACYDRDDDGITECFVAGTGNTPVGGPCDGPWDCVGGDWGRCGRPLAGFPGGYCTIACAAGKGTCTTGSHCSSTLASNFCVAECATSSDCRTGYTCQSDGATDACWP